MSDTLATLTCRSAGALHHCEALSGVKTDLSLRARRAYDEQLVRAQPKHAVQRVQVKIHSPLWSPGA